MRAYPDAQELRTLELHRQHAPQNGTPFHNPNHLEVFQSIPSNEHMPNQDVIEQVGNLTLVSIMGSFAVGKNGAKEAAILLASQHEYERVIPGGMHQVTMGTTRIPEFRDGAVEDKRNYIFAHTKRANRDLVKWFRDGELVQWAQPRGPQDHVYFSWIGNFPTTGVALLDTVPSTLADLDRVLAPSGKQAIGIYRTVETFDKWWERVVGRGDIIDQHGAIINHDNYMKRMREARKSLTEALDTKDRLKFFEAEERPDAGLAVVNIIRGRHSKEAQRRGIRGAHLMLKGLEQKGIKAA